MEKREEITIIGDTITPNSQEEYSYEFEEDVELKDMKVHCYEGQEFDLRYYVELITATGGVINLVEELGDQEYIAGNDDEYEFNVRREVSDGDTLRVKIENVESNYSYTTNFEIGVDHETSLLEKITQVI